MTHKYNIVVIHLRPSLQCAAANDKRLLSGERAGTPIDVYHLFSSIANENIFALSIVVFRSKPNTFLLKRKKDWLPGHILDFLFPNRYSNENRGSIILVGVCVLLEGQP